MTVTLAWDPPVSGTVTGYRVGRSGVDTGGYGNFTTDLDASTRAFTFRSLRPADGYFFSVGAIGPNGVPGPAAGNRSIFITGFLGPREDVTPPVLVSTSPASGATVPVSTSLTATFDEPIGRVPRGSYASVSCNGLATINGSQTYSGNTLTFTPDRPLPSGAECTFSFLVGDLSGRDTRGSVSFRTQAPATAPGAPTNVQAAPGAGTITIRWAPPAGGGEVTGYVPQRLGFDTGGFGAFTKEPPLPADAREFTFLSLIAGASYAVSVKAVGPGGESVAVSTSATPGAGPVDRPQPDPPTRPQQPPAGSPCADGADVFGDDDGLAYEAAINCLYRYGLVVGVNRTEFRPNVLLRREQAASMLVNFAERSRKAALAAGDSGFTDIAGSVHVTNINKGFAANVISGYADRTFRPTTHVSRQQFVTLLVKATENLLGRALPKDGTDTFADDNGGTHESNIEKAHDAGILEIIPVSADRFLVGADVTRGEAAQMINNALTKVLVPARVFVP